MKISLGSDHKGYILKEKIKLCLESEGIEFYDRGAFSEVSVDYPDYARPVAEDVLSGNSDFGILICDTGIGMSIAANKIHGIRAAYVINERTASSSRHHNNANILVLGSTIVNHADVCKIIKIFASEGFDGDRHEKRIKKLEMIEKYNIDFTDKKD